VTAHVGLNDSPPRCKSSCKAFCPAFADVADLIAVGAKEKPPFDLDVYRNCIWIVRIMGFGHQDYVHSVSNEAPNQVGSGRAVRITEAGTFYSELVDSSILIVIFHDVSVSTDGLQAGVHDQKRPRTLLGASMLPT